MTMSIKYEAAALVVVVVNVLQLGFGFLSSSCQSNNIIVIVCTDSQGLANWEIGFPGETPSVTFSFGVFFPRTQARTGPESSVITGSIDFINSSYSITKVTFENSAHLNLTEVECNNDRLTYVYSAFTEVTSISMMAQTIKDLLIINWKVPVASYDVVGANVSNSPINATSIAVILSPSNFTLNITLCSNLQIYFEVGLCVYNDINQNPKNITWREYTLHQNGTWTYFCHNSSKKVSTRCDMNGNFSDDCGLSSMPHITTGSATSTHVNKSSTILTLNSQYFGIEEKESTSDPVLIYVISACVFISIVVAFLTTTIIVIISIKYFKRKKASRRLTDGNALNETYQQLSSIHFNSKPKQFKHPERENNDSVAYSTLLKKVPSNADYDTIKHSMKFSKTTLDQYGTLNRSENKERTSDSKTESKMYYADVDSTAGSNSNQVVSLHDRVKYCDVNMKVYPEDETLNLNSLLIQLGPISDKFKYFGSVAGICTTILDEISDHVTTSYDGMVEVCDAWLKTCQNENIIPTWRAVAEILSVMGHHAMSHNMCLVYETGELPISVDMNSVRPLKTICSSPSPPPIHSLTIKDSKSDEIGLVTVTSAMTSQDLSVSRSKLDVFDNKVEVPPPIPAKSCLKTQDFCAPLLPLHKCISHEMPFCASTSYNEYKLPEVPPKLPHKRINVLKDSGQNNVEIKPSLPPRFPEN